MNSYPVFDSNYSTETMNLLLLSSTGSRTNTAIKFSISYSMSFGGSKPDIFTAG